MINTEDKKQGVKLRNEDKLSRIPIKVVPLAEPLKNQEWIKVKLPLVKFQSSKKFTSLSIRKLHTV